MKFYLLNFVFKLMLLLSVISHDFNGKQTSTEC